MFRESKNLKDSENAQGEALRIKDISALISYTKTNKLITALYMVTDIIDKDEPLRNKLRALGTGIISDIFTGPSNALVKISQIVSFLDLASAINIISEMNCNILRKEFTELDQSIRQSGNNEISINTPDKPVNLVEFFREELPASPSLGGPAPRHFGSNGHPHSRSIGVQKGSTLMKALSDRNLVSAVNGSNHTVSDKLAHRATLEGNHKAVSADNFLALKKQRHDDIINIIKILGGNATIKDIKDKVRTMPNTGGFLTTCGEKTLQRELVSMVKNGVLKKTGEKRWSRYFIKN